MTHTPSRTPLPPQQLEAEEALLGSLLIDPDVLMQLPSHLAGEHFYRQRHGHIFEAILTLQRQQQPIDYLTLAARLEQEGRLEEVGGGAYLARLVNAVPSAIHAPAYAHLILEAAQARRLIQVLSRNITHLYDGAQAADEVIADLEHELLCLHRQSYQSGPRHIAEIGRDVMAGLEAAARGEAPAVFATGYSELDQMLGGFQPGDLLLLGARPAMGKTALLLNFATHAARQGRSTLFFSLEMSADALHRRLLAAHTGVSLLDLNRRRVGDAAWPALQKAAAGIAQTPIWVDDSPALAIAEVRRRALHLAMAHGVDFILLDYVQLATAGQNPQKRYHEVGQVAKAHNALAKELKVPVLAASQLAREVDRRPDRRPTLSDLRESGDLEQHADIVLFIHREKTTPGWSEADLVVAKHRNGPLGTARLLWQADWVRFVAVVPETVAFA